MRYEMIATGFFVIIAFVVIKWLVKDSMNVLADIIHEMVYGPWKE